MKISHRFGDIAEKLSLIKGSEEITRMDENFSQQSKEKLIKNLMDCWRRCSQYRPRTK